MSNLRIIKFLIPTIWISNNELKATRHTSTLCSECSRSYLCIRIVLRLFMGAFTELVCDTCPWNEPEPRPIGREERYAHNDRPLQIGTTSNILGCCGHVSRNGYLFGDTRRFYRIRRERNHDILEDNYGRKRTHEAAPERLSRSQKTRQEAYSAHLLKRKMFLSTIINQG